MQKYVTYIGKMNQWWLPAAIAKLMGVPSFSGNHEYSVINSAFVLVESVADIALIWSHPMLYFV